VLATAEARRKIGNIEDGTRLSQLILDLQAWGTGIKAPFERRPGSDIPSDGYVPSVAVARCQAARDRLCNRAWHAMRGGTAGLTLAEPRSTSPRLAEPPHARIGPASTSGASLTRYQICNPLDGSRQNHSRSIAQEYRSTNLFAGCRDDHHGWFTSQRHAARQLVFGFGFGTCGFGQRLRLCHTVLFLKE
jgi:hypothetical protein